MIYMYLYDAFEILKKYYIAHFGVFLYACYSLSDAIEVRWNAFQKQIWCHNDI